VFRFNIRLTPATGYNTLFGFAVYLSISVVWLCYS